MFGSVAVVVAAVVAAAVVVVVVAVAAVVVVAAVAAAKQEPAELIAVVEEAAVAKYSAVNWAAPEVVDTVVLEVVVSAAGQAFGQHQPGNIAVDITLATAAHVELVLVSDTNWDKPQVAQYYHRKRLVGILVHFLQPQEQAAGFAPDPAVAAAITFA